MTRLPAKRLALSALALALLACAAPRPPDAVRPPDRVLLTNDNGIDDPGLIGLARAFARAPDTEVVVVAPDRDRSGTGSFLGATSSGTYRVQRRELGPGIEAWALDGYPADCVLFALTGPLRDHPPDVVVSGINGGPNLADDWFGSGTIGAARTAAYFGVPGVAVSGVEDDDPEAVAAAADWVVELVRGPLVSSLRPPEYLTISLPDASRREIRGVRIVERARGVATGRSRRLAGDDSAATWELEIETDAARAGPGTDVATVAEGFIAIVAMRADESDADLAHRLRGLSHRIPNWPDVGRTVDPGT